MVSVNYTIITQIVNFIILLWILAKFAYKPLLKAMDDRRNRIVKDLDSAEHARKEAETLKLEYANQLKTARKEASDIIAKANADAQKLHDEALAQAQKDGLQKGTDEAQKERDALLESGRERVEAEKKKALLDVREQVIALSTEIASRVLQAKLTSEEDQALVARKTDEALQSR